MTHGAAKRRDIARSVLPAKAQARKGARHDLAAVKRRGRRSVRQDLHDVGRPGRADAVVECWDGAPMDPVADTSTEVNQLVRRRRQEDKLGPVFRWAKATTKHLPIEERLPAVRRVLDGNLAGRHALSHLAWDDHFDDSLRQRFWWRYDPPTRPDPTEELRAAVIGALEDGLHAELNRRMKGLPLDDGSVRVLAGWHDVDAFVRDIRRFRRWRAVVLGLRS